MKFAFLIMGTYEKPGRAAIGDGKAQLIGVKDIQEACKAAKQLQEEGVDCIELCGAFGEKGAKQIIEATGNRMPVGYVTHLPEQDEIYQRMFSAPKKKMAEE